MILQSHRYVEDAILTLLVDHVGRQAHDAVQVSLDNRLGEGNGVVRLEQRVAPVSDKTMLRWYGSSLLGSVMEVADVSLMMACAAPRCAELLGLLR
eukprot:15347124-Heterocapsa_arctica.AAC.1